MADTTFNPFIEAPADPVWSTAGVPGATSSKTSIRVAQAPADKGKAPAAKAPAAPGAKAPTESKAVVDKAKIKDAVKKKKAEVYTPVKPDMQLGFIHNNVDCIGCRACEIACKDKNGLAPGPRFRRVMYVEGGTYPDVFAYKVNMSCNHCAEPACLPSCPTGAIYKRKKDGIVDIDSTLCIGCRRCEATCPFGAPQYIPESNIVSKCNLCVDEIDAGRKPYCVMACMMRVLDVGPIDKLRDGTYDTKARGPADKVVRQVKNMADPELTTPSIVFVAHSKGAVK